MLGQKLKRIIFCIYFSNIPFLLKAELSKKATEEGFIAGYDAYLREFPLNCVQEFESIKDTLKFLSVKDRNRANLYEAYCCAKIGNRDYAAWLLNNVDKTHLTTNEQRTYLHLSENLTLEMQKYTSYYFWATAYFGSSSFSPKISEKSASLSGFYGGISHQSWEYNLGFETYSLSGVDNSYLYTQNLSHLNVGKIYNWGSLHGFYSNVTGTRSARISTNVYGAEALYIWNSKTAFILNLSYSMYTRSVLESLSAKQLSFTWDQALFNAKPFKFRGQVTSETIMTSSKYTEDDPTGFKLDKVYQRLAVGFLADKEFLHLGLNAWFGKEALGVRNRGTLVFNALRNYKSGFGAKVAWNFYEGWFLKFDLSQETYAISTENISTMTYIYGLLVSF